MKIHFLTMVTHNRYLKFLRPHLASVLKNHPEASCTVFYHHLTTDKIAAFRAAFPRVIFKPQGLQKQETKAATIGGKMRWFLQTARELPDGENMVFIDCDTLVLAPLEAYFETLFDLAYTWKEDGFPLNTGVLLARTGAVLNQLLERWCQYVECIFADAESQRQMVLRGGGGSQYALMQLMGTTSVGPEADLETRRATYDGERVVTCNQTAVRLRGFHGAGLNETHCRPITKALRVIHYKSGWHRILLDGEPFHPKRPENLCRPMFDYWHAVNTEASKRFTEEVLLAATADEQGASSREAAAVGAVAAFLGVKRIVGIGSRTSALATAVAREAEHRNIAMGWGIGKLGRHAAPTLVFVEGDREGVAARQMAQLFKACPHLVACFLGNAEKDSATRATAEQLFKLIAFTDHPAFAARFETLPSDSTLALILPDEGKPVSPWRAALVKPLRHLRARLAPWVARYREWEHRWTGQR